MGSKVVVDDIEVEVDSKQNLIQAAEKAGVEIPHYCWHHDLSVVASCRMCLVETGTVKEDGSVVMNPRLVPACQTPCTPGTVVKTQTEKVKQAQQQTLEYLLLNHPLDCSICDQAGECYLQDYTYKFGRAHSRLDEPKVQRVDKYHIGDQIALFTDRCVMCTRCVRFTREISGTAELQVINRGSVEEIDVFPGQPCNNKLAGNVVDLCPVGALCSKDFLYKKRVWWLKSADSVCSGCSTGCSIHVDQNENKVYRLRPRENELAQGSFMCDDGRFGWKYLHAENRLTTPRIGRLGVASSASNGEAARAEAALTAAATGSTGNGAAVGGTADKAVGSVAQVATAGRAAGSVATINDPALFADPWPEFLVQVRGVINDAAKRSGKRFVAVLSPFMSCEEAYLLCSYLRSVDKQFVLAMGPVPVVGQDDCYPKRPDGSAATGGDVKFTIRAEKCPNRRGVEAVIAHFDPQMRDFQWVLSQIEQASIDAAYVVGGYPEAWLDQRAVALLSSLKLLLVQDILSSPLSDAADFVLPMAAFAEREGTVINHAGLAQLQKLAIRPPADVWSGGRIFMNLASRSGLFNSQVVRAEMATRIAKLSKFGGGDLGEHGILVL